MSYGDAGVPAEYGEYTDEDRVLMKSGFEQQFEVLVGSNPDIWLSINVSEVVQKDGGFCIGYDDASGLVRVLSAWIKWRDGLPDRDDRRSLGMYPKVEIS